MVVSSRGSPTIMLSPSRLSPGSLIVSLSPWNWMRRPKNSSVAVPVALVAVLLLCLQALPWKSICEAGAGAPGMLLEEGSLKISGIRGQSHGEPVVGGGRAEGLEGRKLRVYMYNLPRRFTYGIVEQYLRLRNLLPEGEPVVDSALKYPAHQHSGEWWLFQDLLRPESERQLSAAVRVEHPDEADIFFVPFFSSLSLIVNPLDLVRSGKLKPENRYNDTNNQMELLSWLEKKPWWRRSGGRDHLFVAQDPNSLSWAYRSVALSKAMLLVVDFGRMRPEEGNLGKDVVIPYVHRVEALDETEEKLDRVTLLFFIGARYRKGGGVVRNTLFEVLSNETDVILAEGVQSRNGTRQAKWGMRTSVFCLHPEGDTPSACRMFDAIVNLCIPVVVSDMIELPFEDELDYSEFAVFVSTEEALQPGFLANMLREMDVRQVRRMRKRLAQVKRYFEWKEDPDTGAVNAIWRRVGAKMPAIREQMNRDKRLVGNHNRTCAFTCNNPLPEARGNLFESY